AITSIDNRRVTTSFRDFFLAMDSALRTSLRQLSAVSSEKRIAQLSLGLHLRNNQNLECLYHGPFNLRKYPGILHRRKSPIHTDPETRLRRGETIFWKLKTAIWCLLEGLGESISMKRIGKVVLFTAASAFAVFPLLSQTPSKPSFEVISVKPTAPGPNFI